MTTCCWQKQKYDVLFTDLYQKIPVIKHAKQHIQANNHETNSYSLK